MVSGSLFGVLASALALGAFVTAGPAGALPLPLATMNTGGCTTSSTADTQSCQQHSTGVAGIFAQANLADLSATARIDNFGPFSFTARASVFYFMELLSSNGTFSGLIPFRVSATGVTEVGGAVTPGTGTFNHNRANANVRSQGLFSLGACSGFDCHPNDPASFGGVFLFEIRPSTFGPNVFRIEVDARADTNSNLPTSYAYAFADPFIEIDPAFLALHPEYSLAFSPNVTNAPRIDPVPGAVPLPATTWLFGLGLLGLAGVTRRQSLR